MRSSGEVRAQGKGRQKRLDRFTQNEEIPNLCFSTWEGDIEMDRKGMKLENVE
jgi:hypothetical protein